MPSKTLNKANTEPVLNLDQAVIKSDYYPKINSKKQGGNPQNTHSSVYPDPVKCHQTSQSLLDSFKQSKADQLQRTRATTDTGSTTRRSKSTF